ncbi:hypothetical protein GUITHDRAFT_110384 [Guillardia theta CCMP2712]|uniref:Hexosyltransferase n=2 Tax=Guillardia theta TaxID=55529 RepID=L1J634_GUITC|nr:hypothetical protein GUITHDRAFT_110384 [Guillardia theta CCMP2712]EKX43579.1 hypothetical protein GUITHDRAFT_110384 [Guillardia theta CCMP2712]|eukprot:XP_005830559.1 hypothetical protein GUITHDRAFT_110384 [Guillardia theta CCMP2712]
MYYMLDPLFDTLPSAAERMKGRGECVQGKLGGGRYAIVTLISNFQMKYIESAVVLIRSIKWFGKLPCDFEFIVYVLDTVTKQKSYLAHASILTDAGWKIQVVPLIPPPEYVNSQTSEEKFLPMFSKLHVFNATSYRGILYLDSDVMVLGPISELFTDYVTRMQEKKSYLAWVRDQPQTDFPGYNCGVMLVRPDATVFESLVKGRLEIKNYNHHWAEQGYMNEYFVRHRDEMLELPPRFNVLANIPTENTTLWKDLKQDVRILHFTIVKPFFFLSPVACYVKKIMSFCSSWEYVRDAKPT